MRPAEAPGSTLRRCGCLLQAGPCSSQLHALLPARSPHCAGLAQLRLWWGLGLQGLPLLSPQPHSPATVLLSPGLQGLGPAPRQQLSWQAEAGLHEQLPAGTCLNPRTARLQQAPQLTRPRCRAATNGNTYGNGTTPADQSAYYKLIYSYAESSIDNGGSLRGVSFWRWNAISGSSNLDAQDNALTLSAPRPSRVFPGPPCWRWNASKHPHG